MTQRFAEETGSSACLRSQRATGSSLYALMNETARSTNCEEGDGLRERREGAGDALTLRFDDDAELP